MIIVHCNVLEKSNCCDSPSNPDSEREKEELAMLDDILAKAHHARDLQNKVFNYWLYQNHPQRHEELDCLDLY